MNKIQNPRKIIYSDSDSEDEDVSAVSKVKDSFGVDDSDDESDAGSSGRSDRSKSGLSDNSKELNESSDIDDSPINHWLPKKNKKRVLVSDDSDGSDNEIETRHATNASTGLIGGQQPKTSRNNRTNSLGNILVENSDDDQSASTSSHNSKMDSVFIPDSDDEEEEKMLQELQMSPKTRRSITGARRSTVPDRRLTAPNVMGIGEHSNDDDDDDEDDDDDNYFSMKDKSDSEIGNDQSKNSDSFGYIDAKSFHNGAMKRNRSIMPEQHNASVIQSPHSKRVSRGHSRSHNDINFTTSPISSSTKTDSKSDFMDLTKQSNESQTSGIHIQSTSTDDSKSKNSKSSIIELDSTDDTNDEDYVPDIKDVSDFGAIQVTSTPGPSKKLIQPKITNAMNVVKFVSREYYERKEKELDKAKEDLKNMIDLHTEMKGKLPDGGAKMLNQIEMNKLTIRKLEKQFAELQIEEDNIAKVQEAIVVEDWRAGLNNIQAKHTGKIGLNTHNTQKALTINRIEMLHKAMERCPGDHELADQPPHLKISLMPHQLHAIKWMRWRERQKPKGGLLADDMGLGKTLTVIALVLDAIYGDDDDDKENELEDGDVGTESDDSDMDSDDDYVDRVRKNKNKSQQNGGTLIVCPASLVNQWNHEIQTRVKRNKLNVMMHHGNNRKNSASLISKYDVVMTTYGVLSSEHRNNSVLYRMKWDRLVLDESHMIRNHSTAMSKAACELRATIRWGLTGTPIQNKAMDVYAMLKYLQLKPFNDLQAFKKWIDPRTTDGMIRLHNILKPLLLRRTKAELQIKGELEALPSKTINIEEIDLNKDESTVYMHVLAYSQTLFAQYIAQHEARKTGFIDNAMSVGVGVGAGAPVVLSDDIRRRLENFKRIPRNNDVKSSTILVLLLRLRQICDHPGLIKNMLNDDELHEDSMTENNSVDMNMMKAMIGLNMDESNRNNDSDEAVKLNNILSKTNLVYNFNNPSSKCKRVIEMVRRIMRDTDDKVVIVSQWTTVLNIIADIFNRERIEFVELNGKTPIKTRNDIVVSFNQPHTSERVMLLSLVAGGVGLNLTGANHLLLLDPHWNPQLESQAFDRVYRVGQKKDVQIYKLLCNNTIEKRIQEIQTTKLELSDNVLTGSKKNSGSKLTFQDMCRLFEMPL